MGNSLTTTIGFGITVDFNESAWTELPYQAFPDDEDARDEYWDFLEKTIQKFNEENDEYPDICYGMAGVGSEYQSIFYLALKPSVQQAHWETLRFNPDEMYCQINPNVEDEILPLQQLGRNLGLTEEQVGMPSWFALSDYS